MASSGLSDFQSTEIAHAAVADVAEDLQLVATDPQQMQVAQSQMSGWFRAKEEICRKDHEEMLCCVQQAEEAGLDARRLKHQELRLRRRMQFYEKCRIASEAGFCVIPNLPSEAFAIRKKDERPTGSEGSLQLQRYGDPGVTPADGEALPAGVGCYYDVNPIYWSRYYSRENPKTGEVSDYRETTPDRLVEPEFPVSIAKPQILSEMSRAQKLKVFDDFRVIPNRRTRKGDPLLLGCIRIAETSARYRVWQDSGFLTFLIAWYVDTAALP